MLGDIEDFLVAWDSLWAFFFFSFDVGTRVESGKQP
jgi:hypothetical protein